MYVCENISNYGTHRPVSCQMKGISRSSTMATGDSSSFSPLLEREFQKNLKEFFTTRSLSFCLSHSLSASLVLSHPVRYRSYNHYLCLLAQFWTCSMSFSICVCLSLCLIIVFKCFVYFPLLYVACTCNLSLTLSIASFLPS